jgi:hypothetical protein
VPSCATLFGLDPASVAALFGLGGSLIGGAAAIGGQWLTQGLTTRRETETRLQRERRVRNRFAAYVRALMFYLTKCAGDEADLVVKQMSVQFSKAALEPLVRDWGDSKLWIELESQAIEVFGLEIPNIQNAITLGAAPFDDNPLGLTSIEDYEAGCRKAFTLALAGATKLLVALRE